MRDRRSRNDGDCSAVRDGVVAAIPNLRAFAVSLSGSLDRADDLVQETLVRALANIRSFQPGTNLNAWLFTILRNTFRSDYRKRWREVEDRDGYFAETLKTLPEQDGHIEFEELRQALARLPDDYREALVLVGAGADRSAASGRAATSTGPTTALTVPIRTASQSVRGSALRARCPPRRTPSPVA